MTDLEAELPGAAHTEIGGLIIDELAAGRGRIKRVIYPPGWNWRDQMQPVTGTDWCEHVHVGFVAQGALEVVFEDGRTEELRAPAAVITAAGHAGRVLGDEAVVLIQVDCGSDTETVFGLADHRHAQTG